jgi:hypothetical protein
MELDNLKDLVEKISRNVNFLNHKLGKTFVLFSKMNYLNEDPDVCSLTNWKSVILSLSMKVTFKTIVYICD